MDERFLLPREFVKDPGAMSPSWKEGDSRAYTRWLSKAHYENFQVVSFLLPKSLHQDFYNVYSFCRWADDLGDEIESTEESMRLLDWWRRELDRFYAGDAGHPVFVALRSTVERHRLPSEPFSDLIRAFVQDQTVLRYRNLEELYAYCRNSANPVGRLVLYLGGYSDAERQRLSDATCTALQLANFWQDVTADWEKDRVYIPLDVLARHGSSIDDIRCGRPTEGFRAAMRELVGVARELFLEGLALPPTVDRRLALDLDLFSRGGLRVLDKIEELDYDVLGQRPVVTKVDRAMLLIASLARVAFRRPA